MSKTIGYYWYRPVETITIPTYCLDKCEFKITKLYPDKKVVTLVPWEIVRIYSQNPNYIMQGFHFRLVITEAEFLAFTPKNLIHISEPKEDYNDLQKLWY